MKQSIPEILPENDLFTSGVFNLGFCAVKNDEHAIKMLNWWENRLSNKCFSDPYKGYFTDQKWMEILPCFFNSKTLHITFDLGLNVAPWNFFEREVIIRGEQFFVKQRKSDSSTIFPIMFVHYSGYSYAELKKGNVVQNNIKDLTDYHDVRLLTQAYADAIKSKKEIFDNFITQTYTYNYFENGTIINELQRRLYRSLTERGEKISSPFSADKDSFYQKLKGKGLITKNDVSVDKITKFNVKNVSGKLNLFNTLSKIIFNLVGLKNYCTLIRLFYPFSKSESQIHIYDKKYNRTNIY